MKATSLVLVAMAAALVSITGCARTEEVSREEFEKLYLTGKSEILSKTVSKPWKGEEYLPGKLGGTWYASITEDPKSFNLLVSERDSVTATLVEYMCDPLLDYDYARRAFKPNCATGKISVNAKDGSMDVEYTLRDDLYWSFLDGRRVKVTSDDVVFWYDEIQGDPAFSSSAYNGQFVRLDDGTEARVTIRKIDDLRFSFHFPTVQSEPFLATNMVFGPRFAYEKAKREGGVQGVLGLYGVDTKPADIPSMGMWRLKEYSQGQRLVYARNQDYWKKDLAAISIPYFEQKVIQIVPDRNTQLLLFKQGKIDSFTITSENLDDLVNKKSGDYTVFVNDGSLSSYFWTFNQNPKHSAEPNYNWFTKKEFRQAMSCLVNRDRMIEQVYRGLGVPALTLFSEPNPFYNPKITNKYLFDRDRALSLLESIGMRRDAEGTMRDSSGNEVKFDLVTYSDSVEMSDTAMILSDECKKIGITLNVRTLDFQKVVEELTSTYNWESMLILFGGNIWPSGGSNVWPSSGNLHMWNPLQKKPATEWEARVDVLYGEGQKTVDKAKAWKIWDEYQELILEQCPIIYTVRPYGFSAISNRMDLSNVYFDNIGGLATDHAWVRE